MPHRNRAWMLLALAATGCGSSTSADAPAPPTAPAIATAFDPSKCGRIAGRVTWDGPIPQVPPFTYGVPTTAGSFEMRPMPNPNAPRVDPQSRVVAGAVVMLRGVEASKAKPWNLPPPRVELREHQIVVVQGDGAPKRAGFVRRGDAVEMKSAEEVFHVLRGRGAAFFSFAFPDAEQPRTRTFDQLGRIELTSGAGYYWANAHLFVDDHPYYGVTDRDGRFAFDQVPAGEVSVVAWHPHWNPAKVERDPESGLHTRMQYAAPIETTAAVHVEAGRTATSELRLR